MAKLYFFYSVMNAGKSTHLLQAKHNYEFHGGRPIVFTSVVDDRFGVGKVTSRLGLEAPAHPLTAEENLFDLVEKENNKEKVTAVLLEEVNFMTEAHASQATDIVDFLKIPVMAYGIKNNSQGTLFGPSIERFLAVADVIKVIDTTCHCHKKATMILRYGQNGKIIRTGNVIQTGGEDSYVSVCRRHFKEGNIGPSARKRLQDRGVKVHTFCSHCETDYGYSNMDWDQANDCAAYIRGNEVFGHYPSAFDNIDGPSAVFQNGRPSHIDNGLVCDPCLKSFVDQGILKEI